MKKKYILFIFNLIFGIFYSTTIYSADNFQKYINSNWGSEFCFTVPPALIENGSNNNFVRIFINSDVETKATLKIIGKDYTKTVNVIPQAPSEISLEPSLVQPYIKTGLDPIFPSDIYTKSAIMISSEHPISVYVLVNYSSTSEGFTLLPINLLSNEYIISSYGDASIYYPPYSGFPSLCGISAIYDGTEVSFKLGGNQSSVTSSEQKTGEIVKKVLNKGDVWMISSKGRDADLSGSLITSNLPISVVSASYSANIPSNNKYAAYIAEMELGTRYWGHTFHIPIIYGRKFSPIVRIYAKEANTNIKLNGENYAVINQKGGILGEGFLELRINDLLGAKCGTISSDKQISVTLYNTGVEEDGLPEPDGDPFQILLNPYENYLNEVSFSMPAINSNSAFSNNYLNIIYKQGEYGEIPDDLMMGKFIKDDIQYVSINKMNILQNETIDIINNIGMISLKIDPIGKYSIKSDSKFTSYIYGFNRDRSYGFSAGLKVGLAETQDTLSPEVSWKMDCLGNVDGIVKDLPNDNSRSNLAGSLFLNEESYNFVKGNFDKIIPGISTNAKWSLKIINSEADAKAVIIFWDANGNFTKSEIIYKAKKNIISSRYENYGSFKLNDVGLIKDFTITNNSDTSTIISKINLKDGKQGFEIINNNKMPFILAKGEKISFSVKFNPISNGVLSDSLGFNDDCIFRFTTFLEATVGSPIIDVSDLYFDDLTIGNSVKLSSKIYNSGVSDLKVSSYIKPTNDDFEVVFDTHFDENNPLIIPTGSEYQFDVIFTPKSLKKYKDSVVIISDASTNDNVCLINAQSIEPGLVASSYNWGRKRIFRTHFPSGPYLIENQTQSITLQNTGNTDISIKGIEIFNEENSDAFEFNRQIFNNLKLKAGEKYNFKVQFRPIQLGNHHLSIRYKTDYSNNTITELTGFGTAPKLKSQIVEFDTTIVEDYNTSSIRKINITNLIYDDWEYYDTLYIYDFKLYNEEEISELWKIYGSKGFKIDKEVINFPIKLSPGKTYTLYAGFVAMQEGVNSSQFEIISDAIDTATISLIGYGIEQQISFTGGYGESCIGKEQIIKGYVKNNSNQELKFGKILFDKEIPEFELLNKEISNGFTLAPLEQIPINIIYRPQDLSEKKVELIISDLRNQNLKKYATFSGKPIQYITNIFGSPAQYTVDIGDTINQKITFKTNYDLKGMGLKDLEVWLKYDGNMLKYIEGSAQISNYLNGEYIIKKDEYFYKKGILKFNIKSLLGNEITNDTDLFTLSFITYFPNEIKNNTDIETSISLIDNNCVTIQDSKSKVYINPLCANDLKVINFSSSKYKLDDINPNPIITNFANISFSIAISANTELSIYNSNGILISKLVDSYLDKGTYENFVNLEKYNSGLYFYILKSGPFYEVKKFIINK